MRDRIWSFALPMVPESFNRIEEAAEDTHWHAGPLSGHGEGLAEAGADPGLVGGAIAFDEVTGLHQVMLSDPNYFFGTDRVCWFYSGKVGEAPDAVGAGTTGDLFFGELKWGEGWSRRLPGQIRQYAELFGGDRKSRRLTVLVGSAQTLPEYVRDGMVESATSAGDIWREVGLRLGFLEVGWVPGQAGEYYLRLRWETIRGRDWEPGGGCATRHGPDSTDHVGA